jgi:UDP-glucose 4-epimerase
MDIWRYNMTIMVLGGAGYIGSHTVYALIERGEDVVIVDNLETGHIEAIHEKARFYQGDIRDRAFIDSVFDKEQIDAVIHFAANSLVGESMTDPLKYYDNNVNGTKVLLQSMVAHNIKKIVFSSTAATYGEPDRVPILETDRTEPTNTYGETKLSMEKMFKWTDVAHGVKYVSLRYFNACGAHPNGQIGEAHNPETHLIPLILNYSPLCGESG